MTDILLNKVQLISQPLQIAMGLTKPKGNESGVGLLMNLRKASNHPLLLRNHYDKAGVRNLARLLKKNDPGHAKAVEKFIVEDLEALSDFYIHKTCEHYPVSHVDSKPGILTVIHSE